MRYCFLLPVLMSLVWSSVFAVEGDAPKAEFIAKDLQCDIVFVKRKQSSSAVHFNTRFEPGGNLFLLKQDGTLLNLTNLKEGAVSDPDVSYDGRKILFSMMKDKTDRWHLYEINADGTGLKQLTFGDCDDVDPCYLPSGQICFCSNRPGILNEYEMQLAELLHVMDADGSNIRQISFILSDDFNPIVIRDGRILWCRYEHHGEMDRFPLMITNPDGSDTFEFFGVQGRIQVFFEPTELPDGRIISTASRHFYTYESGALVVINPDLGPTPGKARIVTPGVPAQIEPSEDGRYKTPFAMPDGSLLVSWADGPVLNAGRNVLLRAKTPEQKARLEEAIKKTPDFAIWRVVWDPSGENLVRDRMLYNDPNFSDLDPMPLLPRKKQPVVPSKYVKGEKFGHFMCLDVYNNTVAGRDGPINQGDIKAIRVIEGLPIVAQTNTYRRINHYHYEPRRILGIAPVYEDGSFYIRVPTEMPLHFQTLDANGRALTTQRSWVFVIPGETKLCVGCHENRSHIPANRDPLAALHPPTVLDTPEEKREMFHFVRDILPIFMRRCVECHSGPQPAGETDFSDDVSPTYNVAYETLRPLYRPTSARKSTIVKVLNGEMKMGHRDAPKLSAEEYERLCRWIELGGLFRYGGDGQVQNAINRKEAADKMNPIFERRGCMSPACHGWGYAGVQRTVNLAALYSVGGGPIVPMEVAANITNPSRSRLLVAPRNKKPDGLKQEQRTAALKIFEQKCCSCHPASKTYYSPHSKTEDWLSCIERMCKKQQKGAQLKMSPGDVTVLASWLSEFAGRGNPVCPNIWTGPDDPDYQAVLAFIEKTSEKFVGILDAEKATAAKCSLAQCHPRQKWETALQSNKSPEEWKKIIMRMVQKPYWVIRPPEAAIIYYYLLEKAGKGKPLPPVPQGATADSLLAKARELRFQGKIAEAETVCRQALSLKPEGDLDRKVRLELGVLFTQYGTPALTPGMRASRPPNNLRL